MEWPVIVALILAIPIVLLPVVFVWFLNMGGIMTAVREARAKRAARDRAVKVEAK